MSYELGGALGLRAVSGWWDVVKSRPPLLTSSRVAPARCRSKEVSCAVFPQPQTDLVGGIQRSTRAMSV